MDGRFSNSLSLLKPVTFKTLGKFSATVCLLKARKRAMQRNALTDCNTQSQVPKKPNWLKDVWQQTLSVRWLCSNKLKVNICWWRIRDSENVCTCTYIIWTLLISQKHGRKIWSSVWDHPMAFHWSIWSKKHRLNVSFVSVWAVEGCQIGKSEFTWQTQLVIAVGQ